MSEEQELLAHAELGIEVEKFLKTDVGRLLDGRSQQDLEDAKEEIFDLDPYQFTTLVDLQNKIITIKRKAGTALALRQYLADAIISGKQALHQLNIPESDD
jgi:hypothetical protein